MTPWPKIAELAEAERPRDKLLAGGPAALSDAELLGVVLGSGYQGVSAVALGRQLLADQGQSVAQLARADAKELARTKGVGPARACALRAVFELARRIAREEGAPDRMRMADPAAIARHLLARLEVPTQEEFHVFLLDTRNRLTHDAMVTRGTLDRAHVHPREVFRLAIRHSCARVVVAHNHPSGDPSPSQADLDITRGLVEAGKVIGIEVLDHVVAGSAAEGPLRFVSLREKGWM
jgi:DNA repair protein RadC